MKFEFSMLAVKNYFTEELYNGKKSMKEDSGFFGSKNIKCLTFGAAFDWICVVQFAKLAVSFYCQLKSPIVCVACPLV